MKKNSIRQLKVAILHSCFNELGGAERVAIRLWELFPSAEIFTLTVNHKHPAFYLLRTEARLHTLPLNFPTYLPPPLRDLLIFFSGTYYWRSLDLSRFDIVISSASSFSTLFVDLPYKTLYILYIHSLPRFIVGKHQLTLVEKFISNMLRLPKSIVKQVQHPTVLVANSSFTQSKIQKYYRRNASVIYPPVLIPNFKVFPKRRSYYLSLSRIDRYKQIELAIMACNHLGRNLVVVGTGKDKGYQSYLRSIAGKTIKFLGYIDDRRLPIILSKAFALICCSIEENFGISAVEAMACGLPVIAPDSGGFKETVINMKTGILYKPVSVKRLIAAILAYESIEISQRNCQNRACLYSVERFRDRINHLVKYLLNHR